MKLSGQSNTRLSKSNLNNLSVKIVAIRTENNGVSSLFGNISIIFWVVANAALKTLKVFFNCCVWIYAISPVILPKLSSVLCIIRFVPFVRFQSFHFCRVFCVLKFIFASAKIVLTIDSWKGAPEKNWQYSHKFETLRSKKAHAGSNKCGKKLWISLN